jgi:membrane peptidoglycan carboxypeptidase
MHTIESITDANGRKLYEPPETIRKQVLQPKNADMLADILRDWNARPERWNIVIELPREWNAALKTGTSNICRARKIDGNCASYAVLNTVAVGFTNRYVIAVLVTNADNTPLHPEADGLNAAVPVWTAIIRRLAAPDLPVTVSVPTDTPLALRRD